MKGADLQAAGLIGGSADAPVLRGNRCLRCGEPFFPAARGCTRCGSTELQSCDLGSRGTLWTWTRQMFRPKPPYDGSDPPQGFQPYAVGYVELDCGLKVEARLCTDDQVLAIGMPMRLVLEVYRRDPDGTEVRSFAFVPEAKA